MQTQVALRTEHNAVGERLYMALELSGRRWRLGFGLGDGRCWQRVIAARDLAGLAAAIAQARRRFGLAEAAAVTSVFEAGRDGLWLDRYLRACAVESFVLDPASVAVDRRARRAKSDGLDVRALLRTLVRYVGGEREVCRMLRVPSAAQEDARRLHRELERLKHERAAHTSRLKALLATQGLVFDRPWREFGEWLTHEARCWDGTPLGAGLAGELRREAERRALVAEQIRALEAEQRRRVAEGEAPAVRALMQLCGVGLTSAWILEYEYFGWRAFGNRREVASAAGLTPTPYDSGASTREQGISKAGNRRIRALLVELGWAWLRYQGDSALTRWYRARFADGGRRLRRIGMVALARRLLIALWRYRRDGEVPAGAQLKAA